MLYYNYSVVLFMSSKFQFFSRCFHCPHQKLKKNSKQEKLKKYEVFSKKKLNAERISSLSPPVHHHT